MEQLHQSHRFLSDLDSGVDYHPSGLLPDNLDLSPHHTPFDSFDLGPSSPHYPATPSYNGSFQNSPYSAVSELDFDSNDDSRGLFDNDPLAIPPRDDQDPSEYDEPRGLLMFDESFMSGVNGSNRVSVSITPAEDPHSPAYYDHGSPSSSNGGGESGAENDRRSPASSVSSHPGVNANASPHLNFNQLRVGSPYHPPVPMPGETASPQMKPQSPPLLVIPDLVQPSGYSQDRPVIHAPEGDGVGPRLHIVPATPVSGGEATQATGFRNTTIPQGSATPSIVPSSSWNHHSSDPSANSAPSQPASDFRSSAGSAGGSIFNFPLPGQQSRTTADLPPSVQGEEYLIPPSPSRTRSKSDTSTRPPQWNSGQLFNQQAPQHLEPGSSNFTGGRTVHMNDVLAPVDALPRPSSSASAIQTSFSSGSLPHPYSFQNSSSQGSSSPFLSPDFSQLRRSRSDSGGPNRPTHRISRSEDLRPTMLGPHPGSAVPNFPPSRHVDMLAQQTQFLHPPSTPPFRGHHRRASSGSRERGTPSWGIQRVSPYPATSPSSSPARLPEPLPDTGLGNGQTPLINNMSRGDVYQSGYSSDGFRGETPAIVARPNVTTSATADASMKRRINDAKFVCPVPGCGSTFTRHFNLKGHMRSHNDEKPFQCKWPGCGKGFARQHDCKRHEQLHSNHRPFTCDGCRKPFARLDALNRHLRSEGGSGCMKTQDSSPDQQAAGVPFKLEPDAGGHDNWPYEGVTV